MRAFDISPQHCAYYVFSCQFEEIQDTSTKTYTAKPTPCKKIIAQEHSKTEKVVIKKRMLVIKKYTEHLFVAEAASQISGQRFVLNMFTFYYNFSYGTEANFAVISN